MIKKINKKAYIFILIAICLGCFTSCDISDLSGDGIDAAEDSGFDLQILNFSSKEYNNCIFYMGYKDKNEKFVVTSTLEYNDIVVYKKGDGDDYDKENGFSATHPFRYSKNGLNKYNYWEPERSVIKDFSIDGKVYFKVNLEGKIEISSPTRVFNGTIFLHILENGDLSW